MPDDDQTPAADRVTALTLNSDDVAHLAWLMYCYGEGYTDANDRALTTNWLLDDPATMHPDDVKTRADLLDMAREVLALVTVRDDRVTALTLRIGDLREQRDEARAARDMFVALGVVLTTERDQARAERDEARAQAVAATTDADDLRARLAELGESWVGFDDSHHFGDAVLKALIAHTRAGSVHRAETGASVDPSATPDLLGPQIGDSA